VDGAGPLIQEAVYYANMTLGVYRLLRAPYKSGIDRLREQMAHREERFLQLAESRVFANPRNPYYELFRLAGCEQGDLADSVKRCGLETTLSRLASEGVYLGHDEFKGKTPLVRAGREIRFTHETLLNPVSPGYIESVSSGSRSRGTPSLRNLQQQLYRGVYDELRTREFSLATRAIGLLQPILPSSSALMNSIERARAGGHIDRWFAVGGGHRDSFHYRVFTHFLVGLGRCGGAPIPWPTYLPRNDFRPVAMWIAERKEEGRLSALRCFVSPAVRVVAAARQAGLDISGTLFFVGGEALTAAKREAIEEAGCDVYPHYAISEVGAVGLACRQMKTGNCVHIYRDAIAVVGRTRPAPLSGLPVNSLMFTNLLPFVSRFLINAEMDDSGVVEPATCQCEYSAVGMTSQVRDIYSYGKLTGQGITLSGSDVVGILERVLPERFGGAPGDYQLVEREGARQTELVLRVSPRTGAKSTADVHELFLAELRKCYGGTLAARLWEHSIGFSVTVEEPCATQGGKVLPLHILGLEAGRAHAS
jgi:8-oxo-dGTP pyrophosphatase MutT (NUDIX family)